MSNPNPIVTFRQINQAFNSNEAVMDAAHSEAEAKASYDIIRHGTIEQGKKLLGLMNSTLRKDFEGMGDVEALARLIGAYWSIPASPPLLLDGVLAFDDVQEKQMLPLPPDKLDYKSPWTSWRGAVNDFAPPAGGRAAEGK